MNFFIPFVGKARSPYEYSPWASQDEPKQEKVFRWIDRLTAELATNPTADAVREDLRQICEIVIERTRAYKILAPHLDERKKAGDFSAYRPTPPLPFSNEAIARVVALCVDLDEKRMFLESYEIYSKKVAIETFKSVGVALLRYELESLLPK